MEVCLVNLAGSKGSTGRHVIEMLELASSKILKKEYTNGHGPWYFNSFHDFVMMNGS